MNKSIPVITIDGPGGSGKGTLARLLAHKLNWHILDSGAIYRLLALASLRANTAADDAEALTQLAAAMDIGFAMDLDLAISATLDSEDVSSIIRTEAMGNLASKVSAYASVRAALLQKQRDFRRLPGLVTDGRDMGTIVFPDALVKVFLIASAEERAERRYNQLINKGIHGNLAQILGEIQERDQRDTEREVAPLKPAPDSLVVDSTGRSIQQVFEEVLEHAQSCLR